MGVRKLITVPANGQISIGKKWAGKEIVIEEVDGKEIRISSGTFITDSNATFYTAESNQDLTDFDKWASENPAKKTDLKNLREKLGLNK